MFERPVKVGAVRHPEVLEERLLLRDQSLDADSLLEARLDVQLQDRLAQEVAQALLSL
jgi:hypothetical protein